MNSEHNRFLRAAEEKIKRTEEEREEVKRERGKEWRKREERRGERGRRESADCCKRSSCLV